MHLNSLILPAVKVFEKDEYNFSYNRLLTLRKRLAGHVSPRDSYVPVIIVTATAAAGAASIVTTTATTACGGSASCDQ